MGIIIKKVENEYFLESVSHTPIYFTSYPTPRPIQDFCCYMKIEKLKELNGLEIDKEYPELDCYNDFEVVERISQVKHENVLVYDDLTYKLKTII